MKIRSHCLALALGLTVCPMVGAAQRNAGACDGGEAAEFGNAPGIDRSTARLKANGWLRFDQVDLTGMTHLACRVAPLAIGYFKVEAHLDGPSGRLLGSEHVLCEESQTLGEFGEFTVPIEATSGVHSAYLLVRLLKYPSTELTHSPQPDPKGNIVGVDWIDFRDNPLPQAARGAPDRNARTKILFVTTPLDHSWGSHMYSAVTELLASDLNRQPDISAIVSPDFGWPKDPTVLAGVRGIVFYSCSVVDSLLGEHREEFRRLMSRGTGFCTLHFATAMSTTADRPSFSDPTAGKRFGQFSGGWWEFSRDQSGAIQPRDSLAYGPVQIRFLDSARSILGALSDLPITDEIYLHTKLYPGAMALAEVQMAGRTDTVAWAFQRPGGGRSFGTNLGHPWNNWKNEAFRRFVLNGILWSVADDRRAVLK